MLAKINVLLSFHIDILRIDTENQNKMFDKTKLFTKETLEPTV